MRVIQLVTIAITFLWLAAPSGAAGPQLLKEKPVCEASALHFAPCIGAVGAQRCALVGDNEKKKELYQYRVSPEGTLVPAVPWALVMGVKIDDIEAVTVAGNEIIVVGSHSRKKTGDREVERFRIATLAQDTEGFVKKNTVFAASESAWTDPLTNCDTALIVPPEAERNDNVTRLIHEVCKAIALAEQGVNEPGLSDEKKEARVAQTFNIEGAVALLDASGTLRLWVGLRAPLLEVEGGASKANAILLRVASLATSEAGVRFDGVATIALGGKGIRELTASDGNLGGIAGDMADSSNANRLWHVTASALRNGERIEHVSFEEATVPASSEGLAIDTSSSRAFVVIDGEKDDCVNQPARQMTIDLRPAATKGTP